MSMRITRVPVTIVTIVMSVFALLAIVQDSAAAVTNCSGVTTPAHLSAAQQTAYRKAAAKPDQGLTKAQIDEIVRCGAENLVPVSSSSLESLPTITTAVSVSHAQAVAAAAHSVYGLHRWCRTADKRVVYTGNIQRIWAWRMKFGACFEYWTSCPVQYGCGWHYKIYTHWSNSTVDTHVAHSIGTMANMEWSYDGLDSSGNWMFGYGRSSFRAINVQRQGHFSATYAIGSVGLHRDCTPRVQFKVHPDGHTWTSYHVGCTGGT